MWNVFEMLGTNRLEVVTMPNPGEVGCMLGLKITMPECVTQLVSVEFRSLLVVGTLTPHPGEVSYMRMRKIIRL